MIPRLGSAVIFALAFISFAGTARAEFSGYIKSFAVARDAIDTPLVRAGRFYQSQNSLRLMWQKVGEKAAWQVHYELSPVFSSLPRDFGDATFVTAGNEYRLTDLDVDLNGDDSKTAVFQNLDRLNVQLKFASGDLTVGRQAITFGSARIINPTDVFLPFDVRTFNQEYRIGVDAVRYQYAFGQLGEIDGGVILGQGARRSDSAAFFQVRDHVGGNDLQFSMMRFAGQNLLGAGVQTSLANLGAWFETAKVNGDVNYWRTSMGVDYAFGESVFAMVEYHYNGAGTGNPRRFFQKLATMPYRRGGVFLLGKHYLIPVLTWQTTPLWSLRIESLHNLGDHSAFFSIGASGNVARNAYIDFGWYHFVGDKTTRMGPAAIPASEYGASPDTLYAAVRFYF